MTSESAMKTASQINMRFSMYTLYSAVLQECLYFFSRHLRIAPQDFRAIRTANVRVSAFPGDKHRVPGASFHKCVRDGGTSVHDYLGRTRHAMRDIFHDLFLVLIIGVFVRENDRFALCIRDASHDRTFPCIAAAASRTEHAYFPQGPVCTLKRRERVGRVCVVDDDREILSGLHGFSATGYRRHTVERFSYRFHRDPERACEERRSERILERKFSGKMHGDLFALKREIS